MDLESDEEKGAEWGRCEVKEVGDIRRGKGHEAAQKQGQ